jgi:hypothetical protein
MNRISLHQTSVVIAALSSLLTVGMAHARDRLDGRILIENQRHQPVTVSIDGERMARLGPGEAREFRDVPNGIRLVQVDGARGADDRARVAVPVDGVAVYRVEALFGQAHIINDSGVRMRIVLDGRELGVAAPGQVVESWPLPPGTYSVEARPADGRYAGGPALKQSFFIRRGEQPRVAVGAWHARLDVFNPFPFAANLWVEGERVAQLSPGETRVFARQVPGALRVELKRDGRLLASDTVRVAPGGDAMWRPIDVRRGDLRVGNRTGLRVRVSVDGQDHGELRDGDVRVFAGLDAGVHLVTLSVGGRVIEQERVRVAAHDVAEWVAVRDLRPGRGHGRGHGRDRLGDRDHAPAPIARR